MSYLPNQTHVKNAAGLWTPVGYGATDATMPTSATTPGLKALGITAGVTAYGAARTSIEATNIFSDAFDTGTGIETINKWTTGGTVIPTVATGQALVRPNVTTTSASSSLVSKPTFTWPGVNFLGVGWIAKFETINSTPGTAGYVNAHRFMGVGTIPATWTTAYTASATSGPLTNAVGFEIDTDGLMYPVVYDNGVRVRPALLNGNANLNVGRTLFSGSVNQFLVVMRAEAIFWYLNGTDTPVAIYNYATTGFTQPDVASLPVRFHQINSSTLTTTGVTDMRVGAVGIGDTGRNGAAVSDSIYPWREARVTPNGELYMTDSDRLKQAVGIVHSGRFTVTAAADAATAGRMWLVNPIGSAVLLEVRRIEFSSAPTAATAFVTSPRVTAERVTFTGAPTGAAITASVRDTNDVALVGTVRTASTGMVITAGATIYGFTVAPILTAVGAAVPTLLEFEPNENGRVVLRPGQGIVIRQADAGTASDTRTFQVNLAWAEYTIMS